MASMSLTLSDGSSSWIRDGILHIESAQQTERDIAKKSGCHLHVGVDREPAMNCVI